MPRGSPTRAARLGRGAPAVPGGPGLRRRGRSGGSACKPVPDRRPGAGPDPQRLAGAASAQADSLRLFRAPAGSDVIVVQRDPRGLSRDAQTRVIDHAVAVGARPGPFRRTACHPVHQRARRAAPRRATRPPRSRTWCSMASYSPTERTQAAQAYLAQVAGPDGAPVGVTGVTPARIEQGTLILDRIGLVELLTVLVIAVIVLVVFRAPGAAVVTMATIGVAFPITLWALTEIARHQRQPAAAGGGAAGGGAAAGGGHRLLRVLPVGVPGSTQVGSGVA